MFDGADKPKEPQPQPPSEAELWKQQRDMFARRALDLEAENIVLKAMVEALQKQQAAALQKQQAEGAP